MVDVRRILLDRDSRILSRVWRLRMSCRSIWEYLGSEGDMRKCISRTPRLMMTDAFPSTERMTPFSSVRYCCSLSGIIALKLRRSTII